MNAKEYAEYQESVAEFLKDMDGPPSSGYWTCPECDSEFSEGVCSNTDCGLDQYHYNEPHFSWRSCDCCNSHLGGDREDSIGWIKGAREAGFTDEYKWKGAICVDCVYYLEYGRLDDMTMLEVEESQRDAMNHVNESGSA